MLESLVISLLIQIKVRNQTGSPQMLKKGKPSGLSRVLAELFDHYFVKPKKDEEMGDIIKKKYEASQKE